ncbi:hypothetical protein BGZ46_010304 [Entomortierella lignicola]|nr:hypothetical protein BGZ46_010304 [Entomortierella lignicola]
MLSLIRPSSSICLHPDSTSTTTSTPTSPTSSSNTVTNTTKTTIKRRNTTSVPAPSTIKLVNQFKHPPLSSSSASIPSSNNPNSPSSSYKELVAQFTAKAPQPYGVIPPRKKRPQALARSTTVSTLSIRTAPSSSPTPLSPTEVTVSTNAVELLPRNNSSSDSDNGNAIQIIQPLFHSLQSLLPESTSSSTRLGFWANLKAHYFAATTTTLSWPNSDSGPRNNQTSSATNTSSRPEIFLPPVALRLSNSSPLAAIDATAPLSASLTMTDDLLSLPNLATSPPHSYHGSVNFPVSMAAMDKFKPIRSDTIPLKTFTYHETPVIERPQPLPFPLPACPRSKKVTSSLAPPVPLTKSVTSANNSNNNNHNEREKESCLLPLPLPRHLATRETRSNSDYLRMMAPELRMIRSRKLVSPLKPRGYLPRRKEPFRRVKSSLCNPIEFPRMEDDHPLNDVMFGSWSSVSSAESFLTASSSGYESASDHF